MKIYMSLPITGQDMAKQQELAKKSASVIAYLGHEAINPFDTPLAPNGMDEKRKYAYYMGEGIKALMGCDAIVFLTPKWYNSKGCRIENEVAHIMGLKQFFGIEYIPYEKI